jgi:hypothetical protein
VLETDENSETGGSNDAKSPTLLVGDDAENRQYRSILDFSTRELPNDIVITSAMLMLKTENPADTDIFETHDNILVDVQDGAIGKWLFFPYRGLQNRDFHAPVCEQAGASIQNSPLDGWYWVMLDEMALNCINLKGSTQMRLSFAIDDDNDQSEDLLRFYSGDAEDPANRPYLIVVYREN